MSRMFYTCSASELFFVDLFSIFLTQTLNQVNTIPVCIAILTLCNFVLDSWASSTLIMCLYTKMILDHFVSDIMSFKRCFPCFIFFNSNNNFCRLVIIHRLSTALGANFFVPMFLLLLTLHWTCSIDYSEWLLQQLWLTDWPNNNPIKTALYVTHLKKFWHL